MLFYFSFLNLFNLFKGKFEFKFEEVYINIRISIASESYIINRGIIQARIETIRHIMSFLNNIINVALSKGIKIEHNLLSILNKYK